MRAGYILGQAHYVLNVYSGFQPNGHQLVDWRKHEETRAEVDKLVEEALAKRRELIAEQEAFRASYQRKALIAKLRAKGFSVPSASIRSCDGRIEAGDLTYT